MVHPVNTRRVEVTVFPVEVGQRNLPAWHDVFEERSKQPGSVVDMVHRHRADDEVDLRVQGLLGDVLTDRCDLVGEPGLGRELVEHRGGDVDGEDVLDQRREADAHQAGARSKQRPRV